ncbi:bifunctional glycosyltransferase family 2/GtrA family protein [Microbacterium sp. 18062]|uniref:bifunctional glycosyltransferase family 2/GtrA family protein n=1 Tax=Microbacterium sp. 18062 TaxID=2681410 RepID=UPI00135AD5FF|nr:bifunctional glycosyltransferase family 2/GtrA family protein [Microbacterium sp. 18062]
MIVLVPAYTPSVSLVRLTRELMAADPDVSVVIVDDGSGGSSVAVFAEAVEAGAVLLRHPANRGKGAALRTGFAYIVAEHPGEDVVTADADGQHTVHDILRIAEGMRVDAAAGDPRLILGCRGFDGDVPWRSRAGNALSRLLFRAVAGWPLSDTQTGLRGLPAGVLPWMLTVPGDRFEYEQTVLLRVHAAGYATREIPIDTVYLDDNRSSHFRPVVDSLRVLRPVVAFAGSSLLGFAVDTVALLLFTAVTGWLVPSIVAARLLSAAMNFAVNRRIVFGRRGTAGRAREAAGYTVLATALLASNIVWMAGLTSLGVPLLLAKVVTELVLFVLSYRVQRGAVFRERKFEPVAEPAQRRRIASPGDMVSSASEFRRAP